MHFTSTLAAATLFSGALAHFQLQFPLPRGPFNMNNEPTFCDGYTTSVPNRTVFPLSGGSVSLNSEHPQWAFGIQLSTVSNPSGFQDFTPAVPFFQVMGEGLFCFPIDLQAANISGVQDGANVTLQFTFDGGDGELFQCADLTLGSSAPTPQNFTCTNATGDSVQTLSQQPTISASGSGGASSTASGSASSSSSSAPSQTSSTSAASANSVMGLAGVLGLLVAIVAAL